MFSLWYVSGRLSEIDIHVGNTAAHTHNALCYRFTGGPGAAETHRYECTRRLHGRYVAIQRNSATPGSIQFLTLCEVRVYGECKYM